MLHDLMWFALWFPITVSPLQWLKMCHIVIWCDLPFDFPYQLVLYSDWEYAILWSDMICHVISHSSLSSTMTENVPHCLNHIGSTVVSGELKRCFFCLVLITVGRSAVRISACRTRQEDGPDRVSRTDQSSSRATDGVTSRAAPATTGRSASRDCW